MEKIAEFVRQVTGLSEGEKLELRLKDRREGSMTPYFFKGVDKALEFACRRRDTHHIFFGVAPRKAGSTRGKKEDVSSLSSCWADLDRKGSTRLATLKGRLELFPFPPSYVVSTGGGLHAYWLLDERQTSFGPAEAVMENLRHCLRSDQVTDCSRVLRLPGSLNFKYRTPKEVKIIEARPSLKYPMDWLGVMARASKVHALIMGGAHKFKSRSERDFAVIAELVRAGADYQLIESVFDNFPVGDRYEESGEGYLKRTFESVAGLVEASVDEEGKEREFVPFEDSYYVGDQRVSTFILEPHGIVERSGLDDMLICDVHSRGFTWQDRAFPRSAFNRLDTLQRHLPIASWQWLGTDKQVRSLLVQLVDELLVDGDVPKVRATHVVGRHGASWLTPAGCVSTDETEEELTFINVGHETPQVSCNILEDTDAYRELLKELLEHLPKLNRPEAILPVLGWFLATPQKVVIERDTHARFPILMLFGTRGSGKTSLIQLLQRLMGYDNPHGYDCDTTKFALLTLLGSTNSVPINLKEYREETYGGRLVERMLRLAYDTGYDVRGRPDQTTVTYPLTAPIVIDGEDLTSDAANLERAVAVGLSPDDVLLGTESYDAFYHLQHDVSLKDFVGRYIVFCLTQGEKFIKAWPTFVDRARAIERSTVLPARIAMNYAVLFYGLRVFQALLESYELRLEISTEAFRPSLENVYQLMSGRTRLAIDDFVTDVINQVALGKATEFVWRHDADTNTLWFHLKTAHNWWRLEQRRRGGAPLGMTALKRQLREQREYVGTPMTKNVGAKACWMYPISTLKASQVLDTPHPLDPTQIIISRSV